VASAQDGAIRGFETARDEKTQSFERARRRSGAMATGDEFTQRSAPVNGPQGTFTPTLVFKRAK